jgi:hypothetical protein
LNESDKEQLEALIAKGSVPVNVSKRARALLELDRGQALHQAAGWQP